MPFALLLWQMDKQGVDIQVVIGDDTWEYIAIADILEVINLNWVITNDDQTRTREEVAIRLTGDNTIFFAQVVVAI